jgi:hypothetical protein
MNTTVYPVKAIRTRFKGSTPIDDVFLRLSKER